MKNLPIIILLILLTACQPTPAIEIPAPTETPVPTNTPTPTATATLSPSPTPTESPEEVAERLARNVLDGTLTDLSSLDEIETVAELLMEILAQRIIDDTGNLATITKNWELDEKIELSEKIAEIYTQEVESLTSTVWTYRENPYSDEVYKGWRSLVAVDSSYPEFWADRVHNENASFWWTNSSKRGVRSPYKNQFFSAVEHDEKLYYLGADGTMRTFNSRFPDLNETEQIVDDFYSRSGMKDRAYKFWQENGLQVSFYPLILYRAAENSPIIFNIDPVSYPDASFSAIVPQYDSYGNIICVREVHVILSRILNEFRESRTGIGLRGHITTTMTYADFFGKLAQDEGRLIFVGSLYGPIQNDPRTYDISESMVFEPDSLDDILSFHPASLVIIKAYNLFVPLE